LVVLLISMLCATALLAQEKPLADHPLDERALIRVVAWRYQLDPELVAAIMKVESNGNPNAVSRAGAQGLMQLMPATAQRFGVRDPFDPVLNALGAAKFLDELRRWQVTQPNFMIFLPQYLAAYNAGQGAVDKYKGVPPYAETRAYVRRVLFEYLLGKPGSSSASTAARAIEKRTAHADIQNGRRLAEGGKEKPSSGQQRDNDQGLLNQLADLRQERALAERAAH
jgi:hypothetical protein